MNDPEIRGLTPKQLTLRFPLFYTEEYWRTLMATGKIPGASKPLGKWICPLEAVEAFLEGGRDRAA